MISGGSGNEQVTVVYIMIFDDVMCPLERDYDIL